MALYKIRIYDVHEYPAVIEDRLSFIPKDLEWKVFHYAFDTDFIQIIGFRSFALFDGLGEVCECTKVFLSDGEILLATNKIETFELNYRENYLPLFNKA